MKTLKLIIASGFFLLAAMSSASAQTDTIKIAKKDTTLFFHCPGPLPLPINIAYKSNKDAEQTRTTKKRWRWDSGHWQGVGLNYNGLIQDLGNMHLPSSASWMTQSGKSIGVDINLIDVTLVSKGCFGLITGIGIESNNFRFDKNVGITNDENGHIVPDYKYRDEGVELSKSKITTTYINVPLLAEFQFGRKGRGWLNFGVVGGILIDGHAKVKSSDYGIHKKYNNMNLSRFHFGFEAAIGYNIFAIRARYYPQSIFRPGEGPNVQQANIGFAIAF